MICLSTGVSFAKQLYPQFLYLLFIKHIVTRNPIGIGICFFQIFIYVV